MKHLWIVPTKFASLNPMVLWTLLLELMQNEMNGEAHESKKLQMKNPHGLREWLDLDT